MLIVGYKLKYFLFYGINKEVNGILLEILTWEAVELTQTEFKLPKKAYSKVNFLIIKFSIMIARIKLDLTSGSKLNLVQSVASPGVWSVTFHFLRHKERNEIIFKNRRIFFKPQVFDSFEESVTWLPSGYLVFNNKNSSQPPGLWLTTGWVVR